MACRHVLEREHAVDNKIRNDANENDTPRAKTPDDAWKEGELEHAIQAAIGREPETDGCGTEVEPAQLNWCRPNQWDKHHR